MGTRGFTLVELVFAAAISTVAFGGALALTLSGQRMHTTASHQMQSSSRAHALMERIVSELRMASLRAEDLDDDNDAGDLDTEDANGNGRIEDDWSLADGASAQSLTANLSLGAGLYSDPVRFRFDGQRVWRDPGGVASPASAVLATDVTAMTFTRQGKRIALNLVVKSGVLAADTASYDRGGRFVSLVREVLLRN